MGARLQPEDYDEFLKRHLRMTAVVNERHILYSVTELRDLISASIALLKTESSLATMNPPAVVVGDLHGQYFDMLRMFNLFATKTSSGCVTMKYMFLGDYVDRGRRSLECVCLALILKLKYPNKIVLLRGNHECKSINRVYGFFDELCDRFVKLEAEELWSGFNDVFSWMPVAGLLGKKILCMHGGISPHLNSLDDIRNIQRPLDDISKCPLTMDLLWADPTDAIDMYGPNTLRGVGNCFGARAVNTLCEKLSVDMIVRAHQVMPDGHGFFCGRKVMTVFTAPRYQADSNNKGAVLLVAAKGKLGVRIMAPVEDEEERPAKKSSSAEKSNSRLKTHKNRR